MSKPAFPGIEPIRYQPDAPANALAFRYYDRDKQVRGKRMEDHLRMAVGYWHTFAGTGTTCPAPARWAPVACRSRPRRAGENEGRRRIRAVREAGCAVFLLPRSRRRTGGEVAGRDQRLPRQDDRRARSGDAAVPHQAAVGGGEPGLPPRYGGGAATNPDPEVFTCAAAQVKKALEITHRLGGANFVLWGGCEGHEALLAPHMKRERDQLGRFMNLVVAHKHKIGFKGPILIEPTPRWHTKHHDHDTAEVHAFFQQYGLAPKDFKVNIAANQTTLAGQGGPTSSAAPSPSCRSRWRASWRPVASRPAASP